MINNIKHAQARLAGVVHQTPLDFSSTFTELSHNNIYLKLENLQKTGSFKVRGAYHKITSLNNKEKQHGVIAASAGNHAQGVAYSSSQAGISSTIVMPEGAPLAKIQATRNYGADVILHGDTFDDALEYAKQLQVETNRTFIHPFDDDKIIEGQGTIGLEILTQLSDVDAIVCPIGGGGLIAGIAATVKSVNPNINVYGVQADSCASMVTSMQKKSPVKIHSTGTIADGIAVKRPGEKTFAYVQKYVDDIVTVKDIEISRTMLYLLERNKLLVEGSGAAALAALLNHKLNLNGKKVVTIVSGGNVDINFVSRIIENGLIEAGRYLSLSTVVPDKPGFLNQLLNIIADLQANIITINHQRISTKVLPGQTEIQLSLETKDDAHIEKIEKRLLSEGYVITRNQ
ncbi:threonine ammonia-lyase [Desertibacillus haloalkaliphilus]|uniref:threonine ammonia-lyase n=1 Tax=Desertibacillus haloalkaliphilus TaxID=1328930 RepID=UPI001C27C216|nr:threonine ammonia-lyase [Desertibacillus haloalkaliphilus]MBU8906486.1 threonine ammonia-lyase [Desertibacillus haloalkaliphilus]